MTLEELKKLLGIDTADTSKDEQLDLLLPAAIDFAVTWTNNPFTKDADGEIVLPAGMKLAVSQMIGAVINTRSDGVESETIGPMSQTFVDPSDMWSSSGIAGRTGPWFAVMKPYRRFGFVAAKSPFVR